MIICPRMAIWPFAGLLLAASPIQAEDSRTDSRLDQTLREEIVVTASREPRAAREVGSTLSWFDAQAIAARETPFAPELLREIPGVTVNRGGPVGGLTQIRIRGSEGNHTLVLIDGIEANDPAFAAQLAALCDIFVNDAFSAAHRAHASTEGVAHLRPAYAGRLMQAELEALGAALLHPERPVMAVVGGAKVSSKLDLLGNLVGRVDVLVIGGAMANTFLAAQGIGVGKSLQEAELHATALDILAKAKAAGCEVVLPLSLIHI